MAQQSSIQMPGMFGGLMRYDSEYESKFMLSPTAVIAYIVAVIVIVIGLKVFMPVSIA